MSRSLSNHDRWSYYILILFIFITIQQVSCWTQIQPSTVSAQCSGYSSSSALFGATAISSPINRRGHSAAAWSRPDGMRMVIFGGRHEAIMNITASFTVVNSSIPCASLNACNGHGTCINVNGTSACKCDDGYQGISCNQEQVEAFLDDVWIYNVAQNTWSCRYADAPGDPLAIEWPEERWLHTAVIIDDVMIIFGGYSQLCRDYCHDVWEYDLATDTIRGTWYHVLHQDGWPAERWRHAATVYNRHMYIFGGHNLAPADSPADGYLNDVWRYERDPNTPYQSPGVLGPRSWTLLTPIRSSTFITPSNPMGYILTSLQLSVNATDLQTDIANGYASVKNGLPRGRGGMANAVRGNEWYIYGGYTFVATSPNRIATGSAYFLRDLWKVILPVDGKGTDIQWVYCGIMSYAELPPALTGSRAIIANDILFLFGGYLNNEYYDTIYRYNITSGYWTQHRLPFAVSGRPARRSQHSFLYLSDISTMYMFGGYGSMSSQGITIDEQVYQDLWAFGITDCPGNCNSRGICSYGYCYCDEGYYGDDCQHQRCPFDECWYDVATRLQQCNQCGNRGTCVEGACRCDAGFAGVQCDQPYCERNCSSTATRTQGRCVWNAAKTGSVCECIQPWIGTLCAQPFCPNNCFASQGYGVCSYDTGRCECAVDKKGKKLYQGDDCSVVASNSAPSRITMSVSSWCPIIFIIISLLIQR